MFGYKRQIKNWSKFSNSPLYRAFEKRALRIIFGAKADDIITDLRKMHNYDLNLKS
jgi:hypothetical protein